MNRQFSRIGLAAALCSSLFLVGCDDDDNSPVTPSSPAPVEPTPAPSAAPTAAPAPTPDPGTTQPGAGARTSFLGRVKSVTPPSARIGGQLVMLTDATVVDRAGVIILPIDLQTDEVVRVRGIVDSDGTTVIAEKITVQFEDSNNNSNGS
ncbi:MAG: DUF5666 domain-containing protein [Vicinamibacteria bacterium]